jgi:transcriptional regulator with XRE-family HTH domain
MELTQILGRNVRAARRARGLSQEQLALDADMKRSYLSDLERGKRNPTIRALERLATALSIDASSLLTTSPSSTLDANS